MTAPGLLAAADDLGMPAVTNGNGDALERYDYGISTTPILRREPSPIAQSAIGKSDSVQRPAIRTARWDSTPSGHETSIPAPVGSPRSARMGPSGGTRSGSAVAFPSGGIGSAAKTAPSESGACLPVTTPGRTSIPPGRPGTARTSESPYLGWLSRRIPEGFAVEGAPPDSAPGTATVPTPRSRSPVLAPTVFWPAAHSRL
jgi:hypothetical protein